MELGRLADLALDAEWRRWRSALDSETWFAEAGHRDGLAGVAYFRLEFGLCTPAVPPKPA